MLELYTDAANLRDSDISRMLIVSDVMKKSHFNTWKNSRDRLSSGDCRYHSCWGTARRSYAKSDEAGGKGVLTTAFDNGSRPR